jgi:hypothetical protein
MSKSADNSATFRVELCVGENPHDSPWLPERASAVGSAGAPTRSRYAVYTPHSKPAARVSKGSRRPTARANRCWQLLAKAGRRRRF